MIGYAENISVVVLGAVQPLPEIFFQLNKPDIPPLNFHLEVDLVLAEGVILGHEFLHHIGQFLVGVLFLP